MQKVIEGVLVIIVFYGVFSAFTRIDQHFELEYPIFLISLAALLFSAGLLLMYGGIIKRETKKKLQGSITDLKTEVDHKDQELKEAFKIKKAVEEDAEETINALNDTNAEL